MSLRKPSERRVTKGARAQRNTQPYLTVAASSFAGSAQGDETVPKDPSNETVRDLRIIFAAYENPLTSTISVAQLKEILELNDDVFGGNGVLSFDLLGLEERLAAHSISGEHLNFKNFVTFFINHASRLQASGLSVRPREIFRYIDTDDSGELTCDELQDALAKMGMELSNDEISAMVSAVDGPGDGLISYQEFKKLYKRVDNEIRNAKTETVQENTVENRSRRNRLIHMPVKIRSSHR